jgi:hypothetical protein
VYKSAVWEPRLGYIGYNRISHRQIIRNILWTTSQLDDVDPDN